MIKNTPSSSSHESCSIGILARFNPDLEKPMGRQTNLVKGFFSAAQSLGVTMAVVEPDSILNKKNPTGYVYEKQSWKKCTVSRPRVIYDRFYSSISGFDPSLSQKKRIIEKEMGIPFLNPINLANTATDKVSFQEFMKKSKENSPELIMKTADDSDELWNHLLRKNSLILKPRFGRMGRCIIRLDRRHLRNSVCSGNNQLLFRNKWELQGILKGICTKNEVTTKNLIVQEAVALPSKAKRFFDIRLLVQRVNGYSDPVVSGEVARVSGATGSVPNIDCGGLAVPLDDLLKLIWDIPEAERIIVTLRKTALSLYRELEVRFGLIAELGIDCLVANNGTVWVIEINSKPGRIAFERLASGYGLSQERRSYFAQRRKDSISNPIVFGSWLAENKLERKTNE